MDRLAPLLVFGVSHAACAKAPPTAAEAVTVVYERRLSDGTVCGERLLVAGDRVRAESCRTDPTSVVLFAPARAGVVQLFPADKLYRVHDVGGASDAQPSPVPAGRFDAPKGELMRAVIDGVMEAAPPILQATDVERTVAGYACRVYRVSRGERVTAEMCLAAWDHAPLSERALGALLRLDPSLLAEGVPGFPMTSVSFLPDGSEDERTRVIEVSRGPLADELFAIPADYREAPR